MSRLAELRILATRYNDLQNEGAEGYNPYDAQIEAEMHRLMAEKEDDFAIEWTVDVTADRRIVWNNQVAAFPIKSSTALKATEDIVGFTMKALKKAVALHEGTEDN
jgi:hypothetical protein